MRNLDAIRNFFCRTNRKRSRVELLGQSTDETVLECAGLSWEDVARWAIEQADGGSWAAVHARNNLARLLEYDVPDRIRFDEYGKYTFILDYYIRRIERWEVVVSAHGITTKLFVADVEFHDRVEKSIFGDRV